MNIVEFLEARIAEDEAAAAKLAGVAHSAKTQVYTGEEWVTTPISTERVLAECAAKRAVLAHHAEDSMGECTTCFVGMSGCGDPDCCGSSTEDMEEWPCPTVRALAGVYADHPDYRQEWVA